MGFGVLLIGYVFYLNSILPVYTIPVSAVVMAFGLRKLKIWNSGFRGAWRSNFAVAIFGLFAAGITVAIVLGAKIPETFEDYLNKWVYGCKDQAELLDKIGGSRLMRLKNEPHLGYSTTH